jgi:hypothetical protein
MSDGTFTLEDLLKAKAIIEATKPDWNALAKKWGVDPKCQVVVLPEKYFERDSTGFIPLQLPDWIRISLYVDKPLVVENSLAIYEKNLRERRL